MHIQNGQVFKVSKRSKENTFKGLIILKTNVTFYKSKYYVNGPFKSLEKAKLFCSGHKEKEYFIGMELAEIVQMDLTAKIKDVHLKFLRIISTFLSPK